MTISSHFIQNLSLIKSKIKSAALKSERKINDIKIVAVTKEFSYEAWNKALENNLSTIGESRIQEVENKLKKFKYRQKIELHLIGHLQSNKAKKAVKHFDIIQTVDTIKLLERINRFSEEENKKQRVFLQINAGRDKKKFGFTETEIFTAAERTTELQNIIFEGIMIILPQNIPEQKSATIYEKTRQIKNKIQKTIQNQCKYLSMGMSNDYEIAIRQGATHIRIGTALFGERPK